MALSIIWFVLFPFFENFFFGSARRNCLAYVAVSFSSLLHLTYGLKEKAVSERKKRERERKRKENKEKEKEERKKDRERAWEREKREREREREKRANDDVDVDVDDDDDNSNKNFRVRKKSTLSWMHIALKTVCLFDNRKWGCMRTLRNTCIYYSRT